MKKQIEFKEPKMVSSDSDQPFANWDIAGAGPNRQVSDSTTVIHKGGS